MRKWNVALGIYQHPATANEVLNELRANHYNRVAYVYHDSDGRLIVRRFGVFFAPKIARGILNSYKDLVGRDEILVLVQVTTGEAHQVLDILRKVKGFHPISFLLRSEILEKEPDVYLPKEPLTLEQLRAKAISVAQGIKLIPCARMPGKPFMSKLIHAKEVLQFLRNDIAEGEHIEQTVTISAEWLLDNMYMVERSIDEVQRNLPDSYYDELPKMTAGMLQGLPRIYAIAIEMVNSTAGRLTKDNIIEFINSYQSVQPLTIGELWALPLMLRLRLVAWIQTLALHVDRRMREGELADFWGNRLLNAARHEPDRLVLYLKRLASSLPVPSSHFAEELLDHLFDEEAVIPLVKKWLEDSMSAPIADILKQEHTNEAAEQVTFSSSIMSLIALSQMSWQHIFEVISPVDVILNQDPSGVYPKMNFTTRNLYRNAIEGIALGASTSEIEVTEMAKKMAQASTSQSVEQHIGYYLVDDGRQQLEKDLKYRSPFYEMVQRKLKNHPTLLYVGGIVTFTVLLEWCLAWLTPSLPFYIYVLTLLPFSEIAVQLMNIIITRLFPTEPLPKMLYEDGVPPQFKTLVVVPMLLTSVEVIRESVHELEIRYLANPDPNICFGLLADYKDAPQQQMKEDTVLLNAMLQELDQLEKKYSGTMFFLFLRQRRWSESEQAWIGWERKRGKLEELNKFLLGDPLQDNILVKGNRDHLQGIRYVLTLDADTLLPKNKARELIETISHPLNTPKLSDRGRYIERGHALIQPRVCTEFSSSIVSWFTRIFADLSAMNPYTQAVSNVYQDLTGEGTYYGKGIYDLKAFHHVLADRFPDSQILSHDLIEGAFARVGFASDVCLMDAFPEDYVSWSTRQHRWMRGDFQLFNWLLPYVRSKTGESERNALSWISWWKLCDNFRRAFMPIALLTLLLVAWFTSPIYILLTALVALVLFMPTVLLLIHVVIHFSWPELGRSMKELLLSSFRSAVAVAMLPYECYLSLDALCRVAYRRLVSRRHLLQWITAGYGNRCSRSYHRRFICSLGIVTLFAIGIVWALVSSHAGAWIAAFPFCVLWALSPLIISDLDRPLLKPRKRVLSVEDRQFLRQIARKTWRYFDEFMAPMTYWLPPDNYQTALKTEVAMRTSPTNIGLGLLSALNAYDLRFITVDTLLSKTAATVNTLKNLEKFEGHFLNWYDLNTLAPLYPRYISTVDSGNLLASFWTMEHGLHDVLFAPIIPSDALQGVYDTLQIIANHKHEHLHKKSSLWKNFFRTHEAQHNKAPLALKLQDVMPTVTSMLQNLQALTHEKSEDGEKEYWHKQALSQLEAWKALYLRYFSWYDILLSLPQEDLLKVDPQADKWRKEMSQLNPSLASLAKGEVFEKLHILLTAAQRDDLPPSIREWAKKVEESLHTSQWYAGETFAETEELIREMRHLSDGTNMRFLYNPDRKLFVIGYNVDDRKMDNSYYDLLASEARLASLVAISKENIPLEHWWALGRPYAVVQGKRVLMSWGGTMFEYLMPLLFNKQFPESLLGDACRNIVQCQIQYGQSRGIPWGISESAFSAIDSYHTYQYRSFGIPGVGLKRGLEQDLVVSPYSTGLALSVDPALAVDNFKDLSETSHGHIYGSYGYFEAIDFLRQRGPSGERGVIIFAYMAHHQGMILTAINNVLNDDCMPTRFHADPRIAGVESLLYERVPAITPLDVSGFKKDKTLPRLKPFSVSPIMGVVETPHSLSPKVNLLSNGNFSTMVTNGGGGFCRWRDFDITRWRADTTQDNWGNFYYVKDLHSGDIWSLGFHPTQHTGDMYTVSFKPDKAEFRRKDNDIEIHTDIVVSPEDDAEIRLITLINHSSTTRELEITSYLELALAPHNADRAHPCFNKIFIETEALHEEQGLLAFRRKRSPTDTPIWVAHVLGIDHGEQGPMQFETQRARFVGRGRTVEAPLALDMPLSNTMGTVLDPIFALRKKIVLERGKRVQLSYVVGAAEQREGAIALIRKYRDISACHRAVELAWTFAQLEMRHLRIHQEEVQIFQKLASRILYPHDQLRASEDSLANNRLGQSKLWGHGISGDLPIVVVTVGDLFDLDPVKQMIIAHTFWTKRGLKTDLVIINEEGAGYEHPLREQLQRMIQSYAHRSQTETAGGIFLRSMDQIPTDELNLLYTVARAIVVAARGSLRQQLVSPRPAWAYPPRMQWKEAVREELSRPLAFMELPYFNSLGGFTPDGSEYVIYLGPNTNTPAPWINVIANPSFGTMVSEVGSGSTWYGNSQTNRLTPWSNDPLMNPVSDALYIRDETSGVIWTPTPAPIRELDAYRAFHGQGYSRFEHNSHGIEQELLIFVPFDDKGGLPLRIQRLKLTNRSSHSRRLTVTSYVDWVLGTDREDTQMFVVSEWDTESQALFAYNHYNADFGNHVAFSTTLSHVKSYTADRTEFIGRNRTLASPAALKRMSLSSHTGAGLDPCAALQVEVELDVDAEIEVIFVLGYASDAAQAREMIQRCYSEGAIETLYQGTRTWWNNILGAVQVDVPDLATNFMLNRWHLYQDLSCRIWGRTAFYQSSGAYGFRDQLQDVMALLYSAPKIAREYILYTAQHQFVEGDVLHWWHPPAGGGIRTRISDDLLWLPYVVAQYVRVTGDLSIVEEKVPFIMAPLLTEEQHQVYLVPEVTEEKESLLEHCRRAIEKGMTAGAHGLPLMGGGDWNDGMDRVGIQGKGESVWLAWFITHVLDDFAELLERVGQPGEDYRRKAKQLAETIEKTAWDGEWYRRAYFDDGSPLGSKDCAEAMIDSLAQSWAVISGHGSHERASVALASAEKYLVKSNELLVLLLTPPFDKTEQDPGYIKGYPPGVRENGGQYTHGASWLAMAFARRGDGDKAVALLRMMQPVNHAHNEDEVWRYQVEPYAIAADIYQLPGQIGKGGWTWYTGSAGWIYRIWLEEVLGFQLRGNRLRVACCIPKEWNGFKMTYKYKSSTYEINVDNPQHVCAGKPVDIDLVDDGQHHVVNIVL